MPMMKINPHGKVTAVATVWERGDWFLFLKLIRMGQLKIWANGMLKACQSKGRKEILNKKKSYLFWTVDDDGADDKTNQLVRIKNTIFFLLCNKVFRRWEENKMFYIYKTNFSTNKVTIAGLFIQFTDDIWKERFYVVHIQIFAYTWSINEIMTI